MKTKIIEALKQQYPKLGLGDEAFEGFASSVENLVTDENLADFVKGAESALKTYQSIADAARSKKTTELEAKVKELEDKLKAKDGGNGGGGDDDHGQGGDDKPKLEDIIKQAVAAAVDPLNAKIAAFESASASKESVATAHTAFFAGDYAKKFKDDATDAWERTIELFEATGKKMTAEEIQTKATGYFNKAVARKGVDTSKPFTGDGNGDTKPDFSDDIKILENEGLLNKTE